MTFLVLDAKRRNLQSDVTKREVRSASLSSEELQRMVAARHEDTSRFGKKIFAYNWA